MKGVGAVIAISIALLSNAAHSASETEYLEFIERNGKAILEIYRLPTGEDLSYWGTDKDTYFYKYLDSDSHNKAPYWTKGNFNNDQAPDYLFILFHKNSNEAHLVGFISSQDSYKEVIVEKSDKYSAIRTEQDRAVHFQLEGHGHALSWNESEARFDVIN